LEEAFLGVPPGTVREWRRPRTPYLVLRHTFPAFPSLSCSFGHIYRFCSLILPFLSYARCFRQFPVSYLIIYPYQLTTSRLSPRSKVTPPLLLLWRTGRSIRCLPIRMESKLPEVDVWSAILLIALVFFGMLIFFARPSADFHD
jgi:hypothetical protein